MIGPLMWGKPCFQLWCWTPWISIQTRSCWSHLFLRINCDKFLQDFFLSKCFCPIIPRLLGKAPTVMNNKIHVCLTKSFEIWLYNGTDDDAQLTCGELFGFGQGAFQESPTGHVVVACKTWCIQSFWACFGRAVLARCGPQWGSECFALAGGKWFGDVGSCHYQWQRAEVCGGFGLPCLPPIRGNFIEHGGAWYAPQNNTGQLRLKTSD